MKKIKIFTSLISVIATICLLFAIFAPGAIAGASQKGAVETGLKSRISDLGKLFFDKDKTGDTADNNNYSSKSKENTLPKVFLGGTPIGIKLYCDGVIVVGMDNVETEDGIKNPARDAGFRIGDVIKKIDGVDVTRNSEVSTAIEASDGEKMIFEVQRNGEKLKLTFSSVYSKSSSRYKAGLWIRDSSAGIGTLTFITDNGGFATLGHAVCDVDTGEIMPLSTGETTGAILTGVNRGIEGTAGELCGILEKETTGIILSNEKIGIYGFLYSPDKTLPVYEIANHAEVETGKAQIVSTVEEGVLGFYDVEITKIDKAASDYRNLTIKVTDSKLLEKSGGIVQGMSGSPIVQNGKIVGAVTHVFVNDPTGGYGVFAETMYNKITELVKKTE